MAEDAPAPGGAGPAAEAVEHGAPPGSLRWFAMLFSGAERRTSLEALYGFEAELRRIVASTSHEAAHARLQWWRGEIDRLVAGRATHPLARALAGAAAGTRADLNLLHELVVAADLDLARLTYVNWQEFEAYCWRSAGALQTVAAGVLAGDRDLAPEEREFARRLGSSVRQVEMLHDLDRDARAGRVYAPLEALDAAGVEPAALAHWPGTAVVTAFRADWCARVRSEFRALPRVIADPAQRNAQRHGLVLAALHERWLGHVARAPAANVRHPELGPVTRLWTAWRTALRHA
ncbi:MAG: hypothetical protein EHM60_05775 [Lysobacterales bacterium]|nr:MAG: hypothetical protein EHM60_05775 [Xanthomonadales bacterium]